MKKILAYGIYLDKNFGGPSIVHGLIETLRKCDSDCEIVLYHSRPVSEKEQKCCSIAIKKMPMSFKKLYIAYFARKFLGVMLFKNSATKEFWHDFDDADVVVNLYGICFCDKLNRSRACQFKWLRAIYSTMSVFPLNFIAKLSGKRSIKCTASYGPITQKLTCLTAKLATKKCFNGVIAREHESLRQLRDIANVDCEMILAPDIANAMPYDNISLKNDVKHVGISVSFQIIKQWGGDKRFYYECLKALIEQILMNGYAKVILFPNELKNGGIFDDVAVAHEIKQMFADCENVLLFDTEAHTSLELKNAIAGCEVIVASRYHSCVAALSAGVPVLVVGWHYKYDELLDMYGQRKWLLSTENCTPDVITVMFDQLWNERNDIRKDLLIRKDRILDSLYNSGRFILGC